MVGRYVKTPLNWCVTLLRCPDVGLALLTTSYIRLAPGLSSLASTPSTSPSTTFEARSAEFRGTEGQLRPLSWSRCDTDKLFVPSFLQRLAGSSFPLSVGDRRRLQLCRIVLTQRLVCCAGHGQGDGRPEGLGRCRGEARGDSLRRQRDVRPTPRVGQRRLVRLLCMSAPFPSASSHHFNLTIPVLRA